MTMAEAAATHAHDNKNNNHPLVVNHNHTRTPAKQKKRKRLSQVLDRLTSTGGGSTPPRGVVDHLPPILPPLKLNNNEQLYNNNKGDEPTATATGSGELSPNKRHRSAEVFKFDGTERERYKSEDEDVFSPASSSNKSPHSSTESPRIRFSPLRIKEDEASSSPPLLPRPPPSTCPCYQCVTGVAAPHHPPPLHPYDRFFPASPISPPTPTPYSFEHYLHNKYLPDIFRRRSHSDSDLPMWFEAKPPLWPHPLTLSTPKGSLESDASSPQDSPLDLSMKTSKSQECIAPPPFQLLPPGLFPPRGPVSVPVIKGDVASPTTKESVASRYNLEVSPVVEEMPPGSDVAYVCPVCGQMFSLHDRLAKHMASRHKRKENGGGSGEATKAYLCEVCKRSFARSDMLTRHMRLHTGVKPYTCRVCGQVFSRIRPLVNSSAHPHG
ncbi:unnamed protein product [Acanthoscelides obtectus]|uniref:C2H2-type domain-containing protein n=1 Tax=Acanthoscelides obtectus TaxID=200917 RepID=A0A9P0P935_ACAOB|nr:unnamed protein product [Acanthoscelides obtectus]CAK1662338.1 Early growth response protein 1 [Acanthoscelides obtectus]